MTEPRAVPWVVSELSVWVIEPPSRLLAVALALAAHFVPLLLAGVEHALGLALRPALRGALGGTAHELTEILAALLVQVQTVRGLGELEVRVHTRDDDACVDRDQLDADQRHLDEGVDDQALVEDEVEDLGEPTLWILLHASALPLADGHRAPSLCVEEWHRTPTV